LSSPSSELEARMLARTLVLNLLRGVEAPTHGEIRSDAERVVAMLSGRPEGAAIDLGLLIRDVESLCNIWVGTASSLEKQEDHVEWLAELRPRIDWRFWDRYRRFLEDERQWAPRTMRRLDEITDNILGRIEAPRRDGPWDRRGMVVGQVQAGKTANYIGLICKAADAGYRLIVVLAGMHNSLRSQTQLRLDEGFLGFDTQQRLFFREDNKRIGVGALPGSRLYPVHSLTNSEERGDFRLVVARQAAMMIGSDPILLVVKKNASILRNVIKWATYVQQVKHPESGRLIVPEVPLLVIDDEADNASINTRDIPYDEHGRADPDYDPTAINGLIRQLLHRFEKSAYVGYTATPFANIFIYDRAYSDEYGRELFPRNFIIRMPAPANYVGPNEVFGLPDDPFAGLESKEGYPIFRQVEDNQTWIPDGHKKDLAVGPLPDSLKIALRSFLLVCAARSARGQAEVHNSMLVHVTRFTAVQAQVTDQIKDELAGLKLRLRYGDGDGTRLLDELRGLWEQDFAPTSEWFHDPDMTPLTWADLQRELTAASQKIEVLTINGTARDALTYWEHRNGFNVIAIGGDKLSRGLTLEGLSVSYYLRASKMYDTLMQMGRWFGYRPGYADLCRLYTTAELRDWYRDITAANQELLNLFDHMADVGGTPEDFGLRVKSHPDGLLVTAPAKMRHGEQMQLSFSDSISETIVFHTDPDVIAANAGLVERFAAQLNDTVSHETKPSGTVVWSDIEAADVLSFLESFRTHDRAKKAQTPLLARYIRSCIAKGELQHWTVALVSNNATEAKRQMADHQIGLIRRQRQQDEAYRIRRLVSPRDEAVDLTKAQYDRALKETQDAWKINPGRSKRNEPPELPSGPMIRQQRDAKRGLLLIYPLDPTEIGRAGGRPIMGIALSFPKSPSAAAIEYVVTRTYWDQEMEYA
jgi:Z1 domain